MANVNTRIQNHRDALQLAGLRPVQLWVPDTRLPHFAKECRRQSRLVALADEADRSLEPVMDASLAEVEGWTE